MDFYCPNTDMPSQLVGQLSPWIREFVGVSSEDAKEKLRSHWSTIEHPLLQQLGKVLLSYMLEGISWYSHTGWLRGSAMRLWSPEEYEENDEIDEDDQYICKWYLPTQASRTLIQSQLQVYEFSNPNLLVEFFSYFGGLSSGPEFFWHFYRTPNDCPSLVNLFRNRRPPPGWQGSLCVYKDPGGNCLVVQPNGYVGWYFHEEDAIADSTVDLAEMIEEIAKVFRTARTFGPSALDD
jgi:hypothetical protein